MDIIMGFLENETVQAWIAPIIVVIVTTLGGYAINLFRKKRQVEKSIDTYSAAEEKLIDILRPFFIQELELNNNIIEAARKGIIREFRLDDNSFIGMEEIQNILILDILKTRFIKEEDKKRLIDETYTAFDVDSLKTKSNTDINYLNIKELEVEQYKNNFAAVMTSIMLMGVGLITVINTSDVFYYDGLINVMVGGLTLICSIMLIVTVKIKNEKKKIEIMKELESKETKLYEKSKENTEL